MLLNKTRRRIHKEINGVREKMTNGSLGALLSHGIMIDAIKALNVSKNSTFHKFH